MWIGVIRGCVAVSFVFGRPGGDLLFRALRRSTIGAEGFHGRVRDGIGCRPLAWATRSSEHKRGAGAGVGVGRLPFFPWIA